MSSFPSYSLRVKALAASVGLSTLFLVVYGCCNWITSQRPDVGTLYFEWERLIPFVQWMIVPYFSIDLFFVAAPFLCRDQRELGILCLRILIALVIGGVCFLIFPLRFAFERPHASGWLGAAFDWFRGMDLPYNLVPSLHLAFRTILAEQYAVRTRGLWRFASSFWFFLIGISTVLTYQHHVIDVITGFALGVYCIYFVRESERLPITPNWHIAGYYLAGTTALALGLVILWPWGALLFWPLVSLGVIAAAYLGLGPGVFWKKDGQLHWSARLVHAPYLLGQRLSMWYYRRQAEAWNMVLSELWIGRRLTEREAARAMHLGVTAVLDLTSEFSEANSFRALSYRNIPVLDITAPTPVQLQEMVRFIEVESTRGIVYCHCKIGYSRTAAAAAAYLLKTGKAKTVQEAIALLRQARPALFVRPEIYSALSEFWRNLPQKTEEIGKPFLSSLGIVAPP